MLNYTALGRKTDFRLQFLPWMDQTGTYTSKTMLVSLIPIQIVIKAVWLDLEKLHWVWCWSRLVEKHTLPVKVHFWLQFLPWMDQTGTYTSKTMLVSFIPIQIVIKEVWLDLQKLHWVWCWNRVMLNYTHFGRKSDFRLQFLPWMDQTGTYTSKTMLVSFIPIQIVIKEVWLDLQKLASLGTCCAEVEL